MHPALRSAVLVLVLACACATRAEDDGGATLFRQNCDACHQADGSGIPDIAPPLKGAHWSKLLAERSYLPRVAAFGIAGSIKVGDTAYNSVMPPQAQLTDEQLTAALNFVAAALNQSSLPAGWKRYETADVTSVRAASHNANEQRQLR